MVLFKVFICRPLSSLLIGERLPCNEQVTGGPTVQLHFNTMFIKCLLNILPGVTYSISHQQMPNKVLFS